MHLKFKAMAKVALTSVCLLGAAAAFAGGPGPVHMGGASPVGFYGEANLGAFRARHEYDINYVITGGSDGNSSHKGQHIITHGMQDSFSVGAAFGYGFSAEDRYYFGVELGAQLMPHHAHLTAHIDGGSITATYESEMNYNVNFVGEPGVFINSTTLVYAVLGGSYAHIESEVCFAEHGADQTTIKAPHSDEGIWGMVFGVGGRHYVSDHAAVFAEYDYYHYQNETLKPIDLTGIGGSGNSSDEIMTYNHDLSIDGSALKVGVLASF